MRRIQTVPVIILIAAGMAAAQAPAGPAELTPAQLQKKVEAQVRRLFALGPSFTIKVDAPTETQLPGLLAVNVEVSSEGGSDKVPFYITKDGRYLLRGEIFDSTKDPFAETRAQITLAGAPFKGPANARVTVVEYADFQCPTCRGLYSILKSVQPQFPQVKFVYKDFPLEQIHPWSMTAATAARCAYQQKPSAFWVLHDRLYDNQELISATTAWQTMLDYARDAGLDVDAFRTCMTAPETRAIIQKSVDEATKLRIANTPTVFVNGRRFIGADRQTLEQYIRFELAATAPAPTAPAKQP
ncbi:MAG: thioredoxin domain-containing protein [Acidobacteria bacterium]|nr:thioredoxin domain-containing protein [Acidobacteriota bacterium]MCL5288900.1 thioredoxin domain-containing protein [Acidobacteriota bacterium]